MSQFQQTFQTEGQNDIRMDRKTLIHRTNSGHGQGSTKKTGLVKQNTMIPMPYKPHGVINL